MPLLQSKVRQELIQAFIGALEEEQIPWHKCWNSARPVSFQTGKAKEGGWLSLPFPLLFLRSML